MALTDSYRRNIDYVRISVTDRCNFRCRYCMPEDGVPLLGHDDIMSYEELTLLCKALQDLGVKKIRFTGGEPLVRRGFLDFLSSLRALLPNLKVALTTNGALLNDEAPRIANLGISGLNVSLDTLDPDKFRYITRNGDLLRVLNGLRKVRDLGLRSIKVNTVLIRSFNDMEVPALLEFCAENDYLLRLIEFMPLDDGLWNRDNFISAEEILGRVSCGRHWVPFSTGEEVMGPAKYYHDLKTGQRIGIISSVSSHFCSHCNRVRISASGKLRACLFAKDETDLRPALLNGDFELLKSEIKRAVSAKPRCWEDVITGDLHMSQIGG
ncbi:MAG: GTP 3',8-cyclase MoaA [Thermanaerothrix sp.]|nr:GTP 3',8-cyclase MoaA [Thermanaerothrix sp.]